MSRSSTPLSARGMPRIDHETCTECGLCGEVCGGQPITSADGKPVILDNPDLGCFACGHCVAICPSGSVVVSGRGLSPEDALELPPPQSRATADQLEALLLGRRSIRKYQHQQVEKDKIERVISMASTAPMGIPPSEVGIVVFKGPEKVKVLSDDIVADLARMDKWLNPVMMAIMRPFMSKADYEGMKQFVLPFGRLAKREHQKGGDPILYGADVALLFHRSPFADRADCHIAATYAMVAAESMGLGTCMIGMVAPFVTRSRRLKDKYGIPRENIPEIALIMGYPAFRFQRGIRRRFASVVYC